MTTPSPTPTDSAEIVVQGFKVMLLGALATLFLFLKRPGIT
jgi:hypothetical protein